MRGVEKIDWINYLQGVDSLIIFIYRLRMGNISQESKEFILHVSDIVFGCRGPSGPCSLTVGVANKHKCSYI